MEIYEGLDSADSAILPATEGIVYVCLLLTGSISLILCLLKRDNKKHAKPLLPVYEAETNTNMISNRTNAVLRMNVPDTPRPYLNL
jgi:hypothetical protein